MYLVKKVLVSTYDTAFQNKAGGVHKRIEKTVEYLRRNGCIVDYFDRFHSHVENYDVLHFFMLDIGSLPLIRYAKSKGLKIVLSSIVSLKKGLLIDLYWKVRYLPVMTSYKILFQICSYVDVFVVETFEEKKFLEKHFHVHASKIAVIPSGVEYEELCENKSLIYEKLGEECDYALHVARFDENKNQLNVIKALGGENFKVVFVGGADYSTEQYYKECLEEGKKYTNVYFLGWLDFDSDLLKSAFANAKAIICSSYNETFGLTIIEGILAGAYPIISENLPILGFKELKGCETFNPRNPVDIRKSVVKVMASNKKFDQKKQVESFFSWNSIAKEHLKIYEKA